MVVRLIAMARNGALFTCFELNQAGYCWNTPRMKGTARNLLGLVIVGAAAAVQGQFDYTTNADGVTLTITGYTGSDGAVTIPSNINGLIVTAIGSNVFLFDIGLTSVTIPESVISIGDYAFEYTSLTNVTMGTNVKSIGDAAFGENPFKSFAIPDSVASIGTNAFTGCNFLTNVTIPDNVTNIGGGAFSGCPSLTAIVFPNNITTIADGMVNGCTGLTSISIPSGVTNIGRAAFAYTSLTNVMVPGGITSIEPYAFATTDLTGVYFQGNAPSADSTAFSDENANTVIYYLPGATGWSQFAADTGLSPVLWNPLIQSSASFGVQSNQFGFNITGTTNIPILVEACTNLAQPVWVPLRSITLTNGSVYFSEPFQSNSSGRFYRISAP
jgi:hypothetical protein